MKYLITFSLFITTLFANCNYVLDVEIFPESKTIEVDAKIINKQKNISIDLKDFDIKKQNIQTHSMQFSYQKSFPHFINDDFISLTTEWFPKTNSLCNYHLTVTLPKTFTTISEAEKITEKVQNDKKVYTFKVSKPIDYLTIVASKDFKTESQFYKDIKISTYFFKKDAYLSTSYIKKAIHYIKMYEDMIGTFPFKAFNIVENSFQTGYSMPTFTLIGDRIIDRPFLLDTSLGHEILHQWFGNSVFNDFKKGNWLEGITTYLADHYYKELNGTGYTYRKNILNSYDIYVNNKNETPLAGFKYRYDKASMSIGYGKGSFAFHILRKKLGDERFFETLKAFYENYKFKYAAYKDIEQFFASHNKTDLADTFDMMFEKKGMIAFNIKDIDTTYIDGKYHVTFQVSHENNNTKYQLPVSVNDVNHLISMNSDTNVTLKLQNKPLELIFDKEYDLFRKLSPKEKPVTLSKLFSDENLTIVTNLKNRYKELFPKAKYLTSSKLTLETMQNKNIIFLQDSIELAQKVIPNIMHKENGFYIQAEKNPWNDNKIAAFISSQNEQEYKKIVRKITHYGKYSTLHFIDGKIKVKQTNLGERGKIYHLSYPNEAIKVPKSINLKQIIDEISDKRVIFAGETHNNFSHHLNQLEIIKLLHKKGGKVAIGMEMFQRKFQPIIDDYLQDQIDLKTFLKKTEYFKRWGFDYNYYKPIIDFAKENHIPVIALNLEREITKKVTKNGIFALTNEEKKLLPKTINFTNKKYKEELQKFFDSDIHNKKFHEKTGNKQNLEFLYQSQILWDETMAQSTSNFLQDNKEYIMVVIVGSGHIIDHHGIPDRIKERNLPYTIIAQDVKTTPNTADYVLFTDKTKTKESIKIGVFLKSNKKLEVLKIVPDSIAQKLKLQKDDKIVEIDGEKVKELADLKLLLFLKEKGSKIEIKIKRKNKFITVKGTM